MIFNKSAKQFLPIVLLSAAANASRRIASSALAPQGAIDVLRELRRSSRGGRLLYQLRSARASRHRIPHPRRLTLHHSAAPHWILNHSRRT